MQPTSLPSNFLRAELIQLDNRRYRNRSTLRSWYLIATSCVLDVTSPDANNLLRASSPALRYVAAPSVDASSASCWKRRAAMRLPTSGSPEQGYQQGNEHTVLQSSSAFGKDDRVWKTSGFHIRCSEGRSLFNKFQPPPHPDNPPY